LRSSKGDSLEIWPHEASGVILDHTEVVIFGTEMLPRTARMGDAPLHDELCVAIKKRRLC
jgi:hypothetical protein